MKQAQIGFYTSHHMPTALDDVFNRFNEAGIAVSKGPCLCAKRPSEFPENVVVEPAYSFVPCPRTLDVLAVDHPDTQFYVAVFSNNAQVMDQITDPLSNYGNVTFLYGEDGKEHSHKWKSFDETMDELFEKFRPEIE
ncbi:MAG: hypothetical protein GY861_14910 [bacterium]|nr:hypothetical protein [bacterium]